MLLLIVALVAGQAGAAARDALQASALEQTTVFRGYLNISADGLIRDKALEISIEAVSDLDYFRGEDE
jgi:hypothetical protein